MIGLIGLIKFASLYLLTAVHYNTLATRVETQPEFKLKNVSECQPYRHCLFELKVFVKIHSSILITISTIQSTNSKNSVPYNVDKKVRL